MISGNWQNDLRIVDDLMRRLSEQTDPQQAALMYGRGLRETGLITLDRWVSVSRRGLKSPAYRITRSTTWKETINPWQEPEKLPTYNTGLFGELIYANEPKIIHDLPSRISPDDPARELFDGMKTAITLPQYDGGQSLNMSVILLEDPAKFPLERLPIMHWQSNLWGRATLNLVMRQQLKAAYDRIDREMKVVGEIQRSLLPPELPKIPGVELAAHYETSQRAGGDYYDFFPLPDDRYGLFVADVSGHGTPAAVMMAITHAIAHTHPGHPMPPMQLLRFLNRKLACRYTVDNGTFVTAFYGIYDAQKRELTYASAGHPPARLVRHGEIIGLDGDTGLPLGILPDSEYPDHRIQLQHGDRLLIYTDGLPEAFSAAGEAYGVSRLDAACCRAFGSADGVIRSVLHDLQVFSAGAIPTDDRTMVALSING